MRGDCRDGCFEGGDMSDNNWPDPARPGVPLNPERGNTWHWLRHGNGEIVPRWWSCSYWQAVGGGGCANIYPHEAAKAWPGYLGPILTPAEVAQTIAAALRSLAAERDILQTENALLREALTNAAAVIGSFYAFAETADAVSISGIARCHAMLTSMKKNRRRIEETVMTPARAALKGEGDG